MNSITQASFLNNQGVRQLAAGQITDAMMSLQGALKDAASAPTVTSFTTAGQQQQQQRDGEELAWLENVPISESSFAIQGLQHMSEYYIYNHGMLFAENNTSPATDDDIYQHSAAVLFNWALAHHRNGLHGPGNTESLARASLLYQQCISTASLTSSMHTSHHVSSNCLLIAALNNNAHVHYERGEYAESRACLDQIAMGLALAQDGIQRVAPHMDIEGIIFNIMLSQAPTSASAA